MPSHQKKKLHDFALPRRPFGNAFRKRKKALGLSAATTAHFCREAASQISRLQTGHDEEFSADRIIHHLTCLGVDIDIAIRPRRTVRPKGRVWVRLLPESDGR